MRGSGQKGGKRWERGEKEEENVKTKTWRSVDTLLKLEILYNK